MKLLQPMEIFTLEKELLFPHFISCSLEVHVYICVVEAVNDAFMLVFVPARFCHGALASSLRGI